MKTWLRRIGFVVALAFVVLTFVNASWLAPTPLGPVKLIAHRGAYQQFSHANLGRDDCTATRIEPPVHDYLENTLASLNAAARLGAQMIEVDVAPTKDGRIVLFHDWTVDCRTDGHGETRSLTLAELKALDAGYGYTADGGKTFPFRGKGVGAIPALEEALALLPDKPLLYNFKGKDAAEGDLLAAALKAAGRDVERIGDGFYGHPAPVARIRSHFPKAWAWSKESAKACTTGYLASAWIGVVPEACRGGTLMVPLNIKWLFPGWPNRTLARMESVGARAVVVGPYGGGAGMGIDLPEQLGEIPASYNGYVWVEDIWSIGPALRPAYNRRNPREDTELAAALERRRAAR
ncbi:MAG: glycerophosphodiester phosphodiesterase family protein [Novosphingobium sp.]